MEAICSRCAGLDVHQQTAMAIFRIASGGPSLQPGRTFATTTSGPLAMAGWLDSVGVQHEAIEATGAYWRPAWHVLANAAHVKNVPGRKTDVNDATWLADLLAHGWLRAGFVPPVAVNEQEQEQGAITRARKQFVRERGAHVQRIEKVLDDANLKFSLGLSDSLGRIGRRCRPSSTVRPTQSACSCASLASRPAAPSRSKPCVVELARTTASCMLELHLSDINTLDQAVADIEREVSLGLEPFRQAAKTVGRLIRRPKQIGYTVHAESL